MMQRQRVTSSNVAAVAYDPSDQILEVEFHSGAIYQYDGVSQNEFDALMRAASIGSHLSARIKGRHRYRKLR